ncbi:hypothetical protein D3C77_586080 [compost metagenome]
MHGDEADFLAFFQALEAVAFDRAEVHEQIRTALGSDETKTFLVVKPLDGTVLTIRHVFVSLKLKSRIAPLRGAGKLELVAKSKRVERRADLKIYCTRSRFNSDPCKHSGHTLR